MFPVMLPGSVAYGRSGVMGSETSGGGIKLDRLSCDSCGSIANIIDLKSAQNACQYLSAPRYTMFKLSISMRQSSLGFEPLRLKITVADPH